MELQKPQFVRKRVNVNRSSIPTVTHVDMSARIKTVDEERHGRFYRLMKEFKCKTVSLLVYRFSETYPVMRTTDRTFSSDGRPAPG